MVLFAVAAAVAMAIVVRFSNCSCVCNSNDNSCDLGFSGGSSSSKDGSACRDMVGTANSSVSCNDISFFFRWSFFCVNIKFVMFFGWAFLTEFCFGRGANMVLPRGRPPKLTFPFVFQ